MVTVEVAAAAGERRCTPFACGSRQV